MLDSMSSILLVLLRFILYVINYLAWFIEYSIPLFWESLRAVTNHVAALHASITAIIPAPSVSDGNEDATQPQLFREVSWHGTAGNFSVPHRPPPPPPPAP